MPLENRPFKNSTTSHHLKTSKLILPLKLKWKICFSFRTKLMKSDGKTSFRVSVNLKTVSRSGNGNAALVFTLFLFLYLTRYYFCYFFLSTWGGKIFNPKIGTYLHFALLNPELSHQAWGLNHGPLDLKARVLTIDYAASPPPQKFLNQLLGSVFLIH